MPTECPLRPRRSRQRHGGAFAAWPNETGAASGTAVTIAISASASCADSAPAGTAAADSHGLVKSIGLTSRRAATPQILQIRKHEAFYQFRDARAVVAPRREVSSSLHTVQSVRNCRSACTR